VNSSATAGPDLFTNSTFTNTGVPKNPNNPYYTETDSTTDPVGYNPLGASYIDYGLGDFLYPQMQLPSGNVGPGSNGKGDFLAINGTFKAPTLRNVDKRPGAGFVKAYSHNGSFKSLKEVVHFYNARNLTTVRGEVIDFTKAQPYAAIRGKPLFPTPENPSPVTLINPAGTAGSIGNLGLTDQEENDIVNFLGTLSDQ
jgi:cytochrome c peroxidase